MNLSLDDLGDLQREVMETVWELKEASVHQVQERLAARKNLAYTTVLSVMQKLERVGWLSHRSEGRSYIYVPARNRKEAGIESIRGLMRRIFGGDQRSLFQHLVESEDLTDEDLDAFRKIIAERQKRRRND
jgi:BlaI family transcriptional regulator, penicillinase repressor